MFTNKIFNKKRGGEQAIEDGLIRLEVSNLFFDGTNNEEMKKQNNSVTCKKIGQIFKSTQIHLGCLA